MWQWLTALAAFGIATGTAAQPRPNTLSMSCRDAQALVVKA